MRVGIEVNRNRFFVAPSTLFNDSTNSVTQPDSACLPAGALRRQVIVVAIANKNIVLKSLN